MIKKLTASLGVIVLSATMMLTVASPSVASTALSEADKAAAAELSVSEKTYMEIKQLAKKDQLEVWVNGTKFVPTKKSSGATPAAGNFHSTTWGACGVSSPNTKTIRTFRVNKAPFKNKKVTLNCGTFNPKTETGWGYRKMKGKHGSHWKNIANQISVHWQDMADFGISETLRTIYKGVRDTSNDTFTYYGILQLKKNDGKTLATYYPRVSIDEYDGRIITGFPQSKKTK